MKQFLCKKTMIAAAISLFALGGCASNSTIPLDPEAEFEKSKQTQQLIDSWRTDEPAMTFINDGGNLIITEPLRIPKEIADMPFKSEIALSGKMQDLAGALKPLGIYVAIPEESLRDKPLVVFEFDGKLGDFLNALGAAYKVSFNWNQGGVLTIESSSMYMIKVPQDKTIADSLSANIKSLGAENVDVSMEAGAISYKADYRTHQRVANFMEHVSKNSALVSMQVAIINVSLDKSKKTGIDWSELNFHVGKAAAFKNAKTLEAEFVDSLESGDSNNSNSSNDSDATGSENKVNLTDFLLKGTGLGDVGAMTNIGGQGTNLMLSKGDFAIGAVIDYLSTYGKTETSQSVLMKTLSGKQVMMKSNQEIAYVDSVGVSNLGSGDSSDSGGSSNSNSNGSNSNSGSGLGLGTVKIETVDIGLDLKLVPYFQASSELVTINVDLKLSSLLSFINLSAGDQLGTITRPNLQEQEFTDLVKIRAGETVIIGGITYDQKGDNRNAPAFLENVGGAHTDASFKRNAMIIMIRPTVTIFKGMSEDKRIIRR